MTWQTIGLVALVAAIGLLNLFATYKVLRSEQLQSRQRVLQSLLIWFIPVVGATICLVAIAADKPNHDPTRNPHFHPADANLDVGGFPRSMDGD